jgi:hypothetical protein
MSNVKMKSVKCKLYAEGKIVKYWICTFKNLLQILKTLLIFLLNNRGMLLLLLLFKHIYQLFRLVVTFKKYF